MASWSDRAILTRSRGIFNVLTTLHAAYGHAAPRLSDPATITYGAVGDYPANVASQVSAVRALCDRLDRDRVEHPTNDAA